MRKTVQTLSKYRHPGVLAVVEPLLEDEKTMVFVTEPVETTMYTMIKENNPDFYNSEMKIKMHTVIIFT